MVASKEENQESYLAYLEGKTQQNKQVSRKKGQPEVSNIVEWPYNINTEKQSQDQ